MELNILKWRNYFSQLSINYAKWPENYSKDVQLNGTKAKKKNAHLHQGVARETLGILLRLSAVAECLKYNN